MPTSCPQRSMATSLDDVKSPLFWRAVLAEALATGVFIYLSSSSTTKWDEQGPSLLGVALGFGLAIATMVWCIGHVSGGHLNPAVTIAFLITRKISIARAVLFIIAQCGGAVGGAAVLYGLTPPEIFVGFNNTLGASVPGPGVGPHQAFGVEFCLTFVLVLTVFASVDSKRTDLNGSTPLTIGLVVTLLILAGGPFTGASMNPARSFGPAVVANIWTEHWVYWCGPILGGIAASLIYENIFAANASTAKARAYILASQYDPGDYDTQVEKPAAIIEEDTMFTE